MKKSLLEQAKRLYPKNTLFYSATGALKTPLKVHYLKLSDCYNNTVVDSEMGVIFDNGVWAKKYT